ncbi:MAG: hypothetical protein JKY48_06725 [Flavobacteriales bacterium]|nr:hypothetical protein [Flavobacteriales bacterium]
MSITTEIIVHIRPRFKLQVEIEVNEIERCIKETILSREFPCSGSIKHGFGSISILKKDQHFWSPQLTITVEQLDDKTEIRGLYGPKPSVWTMFIFFYCIVGFLGIISAMLGLSNLSLDKPAGVLWFTPIFMILFLSIYLISNFGKKLGKDQLVVYIISLKKQLGKKWRTIL